MALIVFIFLIIVIIIAVSQRKDIDYQEKAALVAGELRVKYPNFVKAIRSIYNNEAYLAVDNNSVLSYRVAVKSLGTHVGDMVLSLHDSPDNNPYLIQIYKGNDGTQVMTLKIYLETTEDSDINVYTAHLNGLAEKILFDQRFLKSAHSFL